jgi:hypothetical protein
MEEERDHEVVRDVFGESDEDEPAPYRARHEIDEESHVRFTHVFRPFYLPILTGHKCRLARRE